MSVSVFRARYGATCLIGGGAFVALVTTDLAIKSFSMTELALDDSGVRAGLFGALIGVCGLFLTVMLAVLAVVTSLSDDKAVVKVMKNDLKNYDELVHRLVGPVFIVLIVALAALICLLVPSPKIAAGAIASDRGMLTVLPSATLALSLGLFIQTASVARLLGKVLLFKPRKPSDSDSPEASLARLKSRREANESPQTTGAHAVAVPG